MNTITSRVARRYGAELDRRRNYSEECGYLENPTAQDFHDLFDVSPYASRVVELYPLECFQTQPTVYEKEQKSETPFEKAWDEMCSVFNGGLGLYKGDPSSNLWNTVRNADVLSGIGSYGVMLIGIDDGKDLDQEADLKSRKEHELLYLRTFPESMALIGQLDPDPNSRRYGMPLYYNVSFADTRQSIGTTLGTLGASIQQRRVHWSRVVHLADGLNLGNDIWVPSRMRPVLRPLQNLEKISGADAEGFWKGAFPGLFFGTHQSLGGDVEVDADSFKEQLELYENTIQRWLLGKGLTAQTLSPNIADPVQHILVQIEAICIKMGVPKRIFMGSERGELASSQDDASWNDRLMGRHRNYIIPKIIVPLVERLIMMGVLPAPKQLMVDWDDLTSQTPLDKATLAQTRQTAISAYIAGGNDALVPPKFFLEQDMGYTPEEIKAMEEEAARLEEEHAAEMEEQGLGPDGQPLQDPNAQVEGEEEDPNTSPFDAFEDDVPAENAFCPTGEGGGHDNSCSSSGGSGGGKFSGDTREVDLSWTHGGVKHSSKMTIDEVEKKYGGNLVYDLLEHGEAKTPKVGRVVSIKIKYDGPKERYDEMGKRIENVRYTFKGENCPKCGASMEGDPDNGKCNSCGHKWGKLVKNAFCKTGKGGGIDPTCGTGEGGPSNSLSQLDKAADLAGEKMFGKSRTGYVKSKATKVVETTLSKHRVDKESDDGLRALDEYEHVFYPSKPGKGKDVASQDWSMVQKDWADKDGFVYTKYEDTIYKVKIDVPLSKPKKTDYAAEDRKRYDSIKEDPKNKAGGFHHGQSVEYKSEYYPEGKTGKIQIMKDHNGKKELSVTFPDGTGSIVRDRKSLKAVKNVGGSERSKGKLVDNAFCKTGEGGGIDPTCGKSSGGKSWSKGEDVSSLISMDKRAPIDAYVAAVKEKTSLPVTVRKSKGGSYDVFSVSITTPGGGTAETAIWRSRPELNGSYNFTFQQHDVGLPDSEKGKGLGGEIVGALAHGFKKMKVQVPVHVDTNPSFWNKMQEKHGVYTTTSGVYKGKKEKSVDVRKEESKLPTTVATPKGSVKSSSHPHADLIKKTAEELKSKKSKTDLSMRVSSKIYKDSGKKISLSGDEVARVLTGNAFCPTGKGGGKDNSCSPFVESLKGEAMRMLHAPNVQKSDHANFVKKLEGLTQTELTQVARHAGIEPKPGQLPYYAIRQEVGKRFGSSVPPPVSTGGVSTTNPRDTVAGDQKEAKRLLSLDKSQTSPAEVEKFLSGFGVYKKHQLQQIAQSIDLVAGVDATPVDIIDAIRLKLTRKFGAQGWAKRALGGKTQVHVYKDARKKKWKLPKFKLPKENAAALDDVDKMLAEVLELSPEEFVKKYPTSNSFCPTGQGGGVDPSCGKGGSSAGGSGLKKLMEFGETELELSKHARSVISQMTPLETEAVKQYTSIMYGTMNQNMRSCPPDFKCLEGREKVYADAIVGLLDRTPPLPKPTKVNRFMYMTPDDHSKFVSLAKEAAAKGGEFKLNAFTSTTIKDKLDDFKDDNVKIEIMAKKGLFVKSISNLPSEKEVLLSPKATYRVKKVTEGKKQTKIIMEQLS